MKIQFTSRRFESNTPHRAIEVHRYFSISNFYKNQLISIFVVVLIIFVYCNGFKLFIFKYCHHLKVALIPKRKNCFKPTVSFLASADEVRVA